MGDVGDDGIDRFRPQPPPPRKRFSEHDSSYRSAVRDPSAGSDRANGGWPSWLPWVAVVLLVFLDGTVLSWIIVGVALAIRLYMWHREHR